MESFMDSKNRDYFVSRGEKIRRQKKTKRVILLMILFLLLGLLIAYLVTSVFYNQGQFSISLDRNLYLNRGILLYDKSDYKVYQSELVAPTVDYFDNIRSTWLPNNLDYDEAGSHNGENYVAYTWYIENLGDDTSDFWTDLVVDDVVKNIDEAIRVRVYKNGVSETYAKRSRLTGGNEAGTVAFQSNELIKRDHIENFRPGDKIRYTIVFWLEGTDPDCTDALLGGEIKMHMEFNSEFVDK